MRRCFVGLRVDEGALSRLTALQRQLERLPREAAHKLRLTPRENFHATLQFIGEVTDTQLPALTAGLRQVAARAGRSERVTLAEVGAFPSPARPRAVFAGVRAGRDWVVELSGQVARACARAGVVDEAQREERVPHVTLARVDGAQPSGPLTTWLEGAAAADLGGLRIDQLVLFESTPGEKGSRYTPLAELELR
jgi:RNA 2',3'-cyclic 3'-phosphodiesterase